MSQLTAPQPKVDPATSALSVTDDRCDRCGAQAYAKFECPTITPTGIGVVGEPNGDQIVLSGKPAAMLFCAHHVREHGDAIKSQGWTLTVDETHRLAPTNRQQGTSH